MKVQTCLKSGQNVAAMIIAEQSSTSTTPSGSSNPVYVGPGTAGYNPLNKN